MRLTDMFILRPVLSVVVSVFILLLGLGSERILPVRQFPKTVNALIQVETTYYGADAGTMAGFITTPIENAIAQVDGIDYLTSSSSTGDSTITAHLRLNQDPDRALTEIQTQLSAVHDQLPRESQTPTVHLQTGGQGGTLILAFTSDIMTTAQVTDYLTRVVQPQIQATPGVQVAQIWGAENFAVRAWLDPVKLAAHNITAAEVSAAMAANNFTSAAGSTAGQMVQMPIGITTGVHTLPEFRDLVIKQSNGAITRLGDLAKVELGSDNYQQALLFSGKPTILIDVEAVPTANVLDLVDRVRTKFEALKADLPQGLHAGIANDVTANVRQSISEVVKTLLESLAIVAVVVFAFLRSARAALIPVITIPLSLVGTFAILWLFGFSINLLTLLALVLATGLVVDDAIIVVENVSREMSEGATPLEAAMRSARSLSGPIVAMTVVLVAVVRADRAAQRADGRAVPRVRADAGGQRDGVRGAGVDAVTDDVPVPAAYAAGCRTAWCARPDAACVPAGAAAGADPAAADGAVRARVLCLQLFPVCRVDHGTGAAGGSRIFGYRRIGVAYRGHRPAQAV